jgi:hypothetical protein
MEPSAMAQIKDVVSDTLTSTYLSPARVLARAFEQSRDRWKAKYKSLQSSFKARATDIRDLTRARDRWRAKAESLEAQVKALHGELEKRVEQSPPALS